MLDIDGSLYSGSGTIVRQAVAYAALTGRPVRIRNARGRRPRPGLRPQHVRAIEAVRDLVDGTLDGAHTGSQEVVFRPGSARPAGRYAWDIGTAGSATMLALAVLPVLAARGGASEAEIRGGLFQDFAPSLFHLKHVMLPMLVQMGVKAEVDMIRPGYVPAGEGVIHLAVEPAKRALRPLIPQRGDLPARVWGVSLASHLDDRRVAARMAAAARSVLGAVGIVAEIEERTDTTAARAGAAFALFADFIGGARLGADQAGAPHRPAERIGARVAHRLLEEVTSGATIDRHAGDQIIPFAALADGDSRFRVALVTQHTRAGAWLASLFLGAEVQSAGVTLLIRGQGSRPAAAWAHGEPALSL